MPLMDASPGEKRFLAICAIWAVAAQGEQVREVRVAQPDGLGVLSYRRPVSRWMVA